MAELRAVSRSVTAVLGAAELCDAVSASGAAHLVRISPRELLVVAEGDALDLDAPAGVHVEDVSDGWAAFLIDGAEARDAWARVSEIRLPSDGVVTGEAARVSATAIVEPDRITILTPAMWAHHLHERLLADAAEVLA